jgi:hypothetical protein
MKNQILFTKDVTLEHLNPLNYSLKNDYMNNLFVTGFSILPIINRITAMPIIVKRAMASRKTLRSGNKPVWSIENTYLDKFTEGMALSVTWDGFEINEAAEIANAIMTGLDEKVVIFINSMDKYMNVYRDTREKVIYEASFDKSGPDTRVIKKYA